MARIEIPDGDEPEAVRLMRLQPEMGLAMGVMAEAIYAKSTLDKRVREAVRMRIAHINQCQICLNYRFPELVEVGVTEEFYDAVLTWRSSPLLNDKEKLAIEYTERFALDHINIDEQLFERLHANFSDAEIYELTTVIGGLIANGRILQVLQIEQNCAI